MSIILSNLLLDGYTKILKTVFEILINYIYSVFCKEACQKDPTLVLRAGDFATIGQEYLIEFLTKNGDTLRQIEVWDKLMEWTIAKSNSKLPSDVTKWTNNNVTTFVFLQIWQAHK
ncbi:unnamed protein product [Rhizophagus irregularis]|nr:unnamed protein product [Rhizophagus irregularis]